VSQKGVAHLKNKTAVALSAYALLTPAVVVLPIILWKLPTPLIASTYGETYKLVELFGFCASVWLIGYAYLELRRSKSLKQSLPTLLLVLVSFHFLVLFTEYSIKMPDFGCYQFAAQAVLQGKNPYAACYLYPPFTAQVLAWGYRFTALVSSQIQPAVSEESVWRLVFYFYQCNQFFLIQLTYLLCYRFTRSMGLKIVPASLLVSALLLFNNPLVRTLRHNQVNLYVLDLILLAVLLLNRYPVLSGLAVALGTHIKLLPLALVLPWGAAMKRMAVVAAATAFLAIGLIQTDWGRDLTLWYQFLIFARASPDSFGFLVTPFFRENSLHSLVFNSLQMVARLTNAEPASIRNASNIVVAVATLAVSIWFVVRVMQREKVRMLGGGLTGCLANNEDTLRMYGHSMDALAFTLIVAPLVWEHQYVLAIPIVLWAVATRGYANLCWIGIAAFLMFSLPTFDVFPFSYHRLVGLVMLLYCTSPRRLPILASLTIGSDAPTNELSAMEDFSSKPVSGRKTAHTD